jgi:hypothetical protein
MKSRKIMKKKYIKLNFMFFMSFMVNTDSE